MRYNDAESQTNHQPIEEKSSLEKSFEAFLESTRKVQIQLDSILPNNSQIQDPYTNFQFPPQQEEPVDFEESMESMIRAKIPLPSPSI